MWILSICGLFASIDLFSISIFSILHTLSCTRNMMSHAKWRRKQKKTGENLNNLVLCHCVFTVILWMSQTAHTSGYLQYCTFSSHTFLFVAPFYYSESWGSACSNNMEVSCQIRHLRYSACQTDTYIHPTHHSTRGTKKEQAEGKSRDMRGLFSAGWGWGGRKVWEDGDRLHADLQSKPHVCLEREKEHTGTEKENARVRYIWETLAEQKMRQQPVSHANIARRNMSGFILFLVSSPTVMFGNCMKHSRAKFRLQEKRCKIPNSV